MGIIERNDNKMKLIRKTIIILCIFILIGIGIGIYRQTHTDKNNEITKLENKVDQLTQEEQAEKLRKAQLLALQNPEIIMNECERVGQLLIYKNSTTYRDIIKENSFWGSKSIYLDLTYNFGITYDLNNITVDCFEDDTVYLKVDKSRLMLSYIELDNESSKVESKKSIFIKQFKPEDVKILIQQSTDKTRQSINSNQEMFNMAMNNLKEELGKMAVNLGYGKCVVEEE
jgi:hypothetical protein